MASFAGLGACATRGVLPAAQTAANLFFCLRALLDVLPRPRVGALDRHDREGPHDRANEFLVRGLDGVPAHARPRRAAARARAPRRHRRHYTPPTQIVRRCELLAPLPRPLFAGIVCRPLGGPPVLRTPAYDSVHLCSAHRWNPQADFAKLPIAIVFGTPPRLAPNLSAWFARTRHTRGSLPLAASGQPRRRRVSAPRPRPAALLRAAASAALNSQVESVERRRAPQGGAISPARRSSSAAINA